ncbi:NAD(P)H-binding protein [Dactylosporangium matsuzakiense]|uniref:NmrA family transcriptional regulator n=1 Tax=Dactylosporangium matsuzakiense TaxID=53360 RepID=A0A9W6KHR4_9ACTN|nr:NAD(P)H-binding protein [Dactylosporangium matsuzakiense]GLL02312.1 NmrA family transcriptional regulator [Dactylosporangium matsuzakiense]
MNNDLIIVTGATGQLGRQIVERLLARVPAGRVGVSVRDPQKAAFPNARRGDFTDPATLKEAFEGAGQVLIVSTNTAGEAALAQHRTAIDAARDAGAGRILYTSHQGAAANSRFEPMPDHAATEAYLAASGTPWTALRNGFYVSTIAHLLGRAVETGELVAPADGPVSWTAHADLAEAAAVILADGGFDGPTPPLTAPDAVDLEGVAAIVGDLTGRTVRRVVADDQEWVAGLVSHGVPQAQATMLLGMFEASRRGEFAPTGPLLEQLIGRPATPVRAYLETLLR